ncbi:MAG: signal recognition particle receptor subunit alpha, partial [Methyloceanibacter sp.]
MSEAKKPSFVERLFGGGTPSSPEPSSSAKEPLAKGPEKKEPPRERPVEDGPPDRKRPPKRVEAEADHVSEQPKRSWFAELRKGLARSSLALSDNLASALTKRKLDEETLDQLEEVLIKADLGVAVAGRIREIVAKGRYDRGLSPDAVRAVLAAEVARVLEPLAQPFVPDRAARPHV